LNTSMQLKDNKKITHPFYLRQQPHEFMWVSWVYVTVMSLCECMLVSWLYLSASGVCYCKCMRVYVSVCECKWVYVSVCECMW
jgi:hypothetical protein